jgi:uncharacterized surface protein with fasciclin (FAS1) repeats
MLRMVLAFITRGVRNFPHQVKVMANLVDTLTQAGSFNTLLSVMEAAGLTDILQGADPIAVLAPTDEAFAQLPQEKTEALLQNLTQLRKVVSYHLLFGDVRSDDLTQIDEAPTVEGSVVAVESNGVIKINEATVIQSDILTDNGVIHVIDRVLMPAMVSEQLSQ